MSEEKSWFARNIIDTGSKKKKEVIPQQQQTNTPNYPVYSGTTPSTGTYTPPPVASGYAGPSVDSEKFRAHFDEVFDAANLPGPDYYEFKKIVEELEKQGLGSGAFIAAYTSLKVSGKITKDHLLSTGRQYLTILEQDKSEFLTNLSQAEKSEIEGRKAKIASLEKTNAEKQALIQRLNEEMTASVNEQRQLSSELTMQQEKLKQSENNYLFALDVKKNSIQKDLDRIQSELQ